LPKTMSKRVEGVLVRNGHGAVRVISHPSFKNFGTFTDSKSASIHRWFQYPAGFSYRAVEYFLDAHDINPGDMVYDPFLGTGTTSVVCKRLGIESLGVEAHPFVWWVAKTKLDWHYDMAQLQKSAMHFLETVGRKIQTEAKKVDTGQVPELVHKCYTSENLQKLVYIRDMIDSKVPDDEKDLFKLALVCALREASAAATGWPYIAPKKKIQEKDGLLAFRTKLLQMIRDLETTPEIRRGTKAEAILADSRETTLPESFVDLIFTSPPYLNNYDYADRTRLEMYFLGQVKSWGDITRHVRDKLIISATTQIVRSNYEVSDIASDNLKRYAPDVSEEIQEKVDQLSERRLAKGGKKSYDIMMGQYFNDMLEVLKDSLRLLKDGSCFVLILGDSAPYGVYIPTDEYLGRIALGLGYREYSIAQLRARGSKWAGNPQRHHVPLKEVILSLRK
jgi:DNA modification methylase